MSLSYKTNLKQNEIISVSEDYLEEKGYKIDTKGNTIEANLPAEKNSKIAVDATSKGKFTITFEGKSVLEDAVNLFNILSGKVQPEEEFSCTSCGYALHGEVNYCPNCGQKLS